MKANDSSISQYKSFQSFVVIPWCFSHKRRQTGVKSLKSTNLQFCR